MKTMRSDSFRTSLVPLTPTIQKPSYDISQLLDAILLHPKKLWRIISISKLISLPIWRNKKSAIPHSVIRLSSYRTEHAHLGGLKSIYFLRRIPLLGIFSTSYCSYSWSLHNQLQFLAEKRKRKRWTAILSRDLGGNNSVQ